MPVDLNVVPLKHAISYLKITWTSSHHRCSIRCRASSTPRPARGGNNLSSHAAGWGMERTGLRGGRQCDWRSTSDAIFFQWMALDGVFYLPPHHTTCIFSLPVHGGPAAHLLGGPIYRNQHSIFHQAPKTTQYYVCFEAENITTGVEQGRGEVRVIKRLKRADAPLLP